MPPRFVYKLLLLCLLLVSNIIYAQQPVKNKVLHYNLKDGLSFGVVNSIMQDDRGFMWFATNDGLNRFDGNTFKVFKAKPGDSSSLNSNYVQRIVKAGDGAIWVSSRNGLSRLDTKTEKFTHINVPLPPNVKNDISNIAPGTNNNIWISWYGYGLSYLKTKTGAVTNYSQRTVPWLAGNRIISILEDSKGLLWVGTQDDGISILKQNNGRITGYIPVPPQIKNLPETRIHQIFEDHFHNVWIAAGTGLIYYNRAQNKFSLLQGNLPDVKGKRYISVIENAGHQLLVGLQDGGLYKVALGDTANFNTAKFAMQPVIGNDGYYITQRSVQTLYTDRDNNVWAGTYGDGIYMVSSINESFIRIQKKNVTAKGESLVRFWGITQDNNGMLWLGTDGDGIFKANADGTIIKQYKADGPGSITDNAVIAAHTDTDNNLWFGTYAGGLFLYNRDAGSFTRFSHKPGNNTSIGSNDVRVIYQDKNKNLWVGTNGGGLARYNQHTKTFTNYTPANSGISGYDVRSVIGDGKGNLFIGTYGGGLSYYDAATKTYKRYFTAAQEKTHIPGRVIFSLYHDKQNRLWLGTEGDGLVVYNINTKTFKKYNENTGLANNTVYAIKDAGNGSVWLSSNKGLSSIDTRSGKIMNYNQLDGIQPGQFNGGSAIFNAQNRLMCFGGTEGLNIFNPDNVRQSNYKPQVIITGLQVFDGQASSSTDVLPQLVNQAGQLVLQPNQAVFSIQYSSLNYAYPQKGNYAYKLEGLDHGWNYVGNQRIATYRYLKPGNYVFKVKASNQDGIWFNEYQTLSITVLPPWYRTWWACLCYTLAAGMVIYYVIQYRLTQTKLKYDIKIAQLSAEKDKELNERKLAFFTNISHEFRTPLTLIINPVKEMLFGKGEKPDAGNLNIVYRNARRLLSLVDQLLLFRKAESDTDKLKPVRLNIVSLCHEVFLCFNHQAQTRHINFKFVSGSEDVEVFADREKIEIALFNLISNALKFTPEHGAVTCTVTETGNHVNIEIKDTGCGIAGGTGNRLFNRFYQVQSNQQAGGFGIGLYLVKVFIESHKGSISYTSTVGEGTAFTIQLLKGQAHLGNQLVFENVAESSVFLDELMDSADETTATPDAEIALSGMVATNLSTDTKSMLLVEDNHEIRAYLKQIFIGSFEVFEADNGTKGLELAGSLVPDIIISDVMMQGLSGIELCSRIKEDPALNHIPVILLTASSSSEAKLKGIEGGADDYISKPFEKEILIARVNGLLKSRNNLQNYFFNEITLQANTLKISPEYKEFLEKCLAIVEKNITDPNFNIKTLAAEIGMSHSNLYKRIKSISGQSANSFIRFIRLRKAAELLLTTDSTVTEAAYKVGLNDLKYFREQFNKLFGVNPSDYIRKYRKPFYNNYNVSRDVIKKK